MAEQTIEVYKVKYIPTGHTYDYTKEQCDKLVKSEPFNFQVVDENYKAPEPEVKTSTIMQQVIIDDNANAEGNSEGEDNSHDNVDEVNPYKDLKNKDAVIALLKERKIGYSASATRAELEAILVADDKANAEGN